MTAGKYHTGRRPLLGQSNNSLTLLIAANIILFVALNLIKIIYFLSYDATTAELFFQKQVLGWFVLPASAEQFFTRPWTILVYMFSQYSVWGLIGTVLWTWAFGYILQDLTGNKKLIPVYLYGGFTGAVFFLLSVNLIPALQQQIAIMPALMGGGAAVMAVAIATTTLSPDYRLFPMINGGIPLWVLTLVFVVVDYGTVASHGGGYIIAHLGGGVTGFVFTKQLRSGNDWSNWMNDLVDWLDDLFNPEKKHAKKTEKEKLFYRSATKPYQKKTNISQQKLDEILDKINQKGYHLLSDEEKEFLKRASKEEL